MQGKKEINMAKKTNRQVPGCKAPKEEWKDVVGYEGLYEVSSLGQIRNVKRQTILAAPPGKDGYRALVLSKNGKVKCFAVHTVVANAFIGPKPYPISQVKHKDHNKMNAAVGNLEWVMPSQNKWMLDRKKENKKTKVA